MGSVEKIESFLGREMFQDIHQKHDILGLVGNRLQVIEEIAAGYRWDTQLMGEVYLFRGDVDTCQVLVALRLQLK